MIKYKCPRCGVQMESPEGLAGLNEACPECRYGVTVPAAMHTDSPAVLYEGCPSHWAFAGLYASGTLAFLARCVWFGLAEEKIGAFVLLGLAGILVLAGITERLANHYQVTSHEIRREHRFLSVDLSEIPMESVQEIRIQQGLFERLANVGSIGFSSAASGKVEIVFRGVKGPKELRALVSDRRRALVEALAHHSGVQSPVQPAIGGGRHEA